ncbi:MAG: deoxyguanosinetriphosphate triphosphohydrolase [Actinobacteria bacterium]|nr:deoxyguanosinetriphosphate triphosphohydrolase [Actinomycetota bacterium]MBU4489329.1 deoxyguanosinetriphosphate triphosphohydrolase [Actinomycetota bacterium]MCG2795279.1 deoxyguanosinetriphosphate triphosphohydrolase [Actinomycetes bacterium]
MTIRERIEEIERKVLSPRAALAAETRGRERPEEPCDIRTAYQRDRDRIIHCKAFRRLKHKTQVFLAPEGDHYRTRLTHTMEVAQISRTIARALALNEDLTEAIALGHDLGHTPFGHIGENALSEYVPGEFEHNIQSLRVVEHLEYEGKGLNLTWEVRDGIVNHTGEGMPATLEGQIVRTADRIAYINHDIDDALRAGILRTEDLPAEPMEVLGRYPSQRIDYLAHDMVESSSDLEAIRLSERTWELMDRLRDFLFENVYIGSVAKAEEDKAVRVLRSLAEHYLENPGQLPDEFQPEDKDELPLKVCDYVAGMTDRYALTKYREFFLPRSWVAE